MYTPGPWEMWNSHGSHIMRNWRIGERNSCPGIVRPVAVMCGSDVQRSPEEEYANARLIASAPKLLETLKALYADAVDREETINEETDEEYDDWKAVRLAIEEAEGKE